MKVRTKIIIGVVALVFIATTAMGIKMKLDHSGDPYYTYLKDPGVLSESRLSDIDPDTDVVEYDYNTVAFDEDGNKLEVQFSSFIDRPLKQGSYLMLIYNSKNGVITYQEVTKDDIPEKAWKELEKYAG